MLTVRREGHVMSPHTFARRRTVAAATATALITPLLVAAPAMAEGCGVVPGQPRDHANCNVVTHKPGTGGGGGGGTGGGNSGPTLPPPPEGLTPDEAQGVVQVPGAPAPTPAPITTADLLAIAKASTVFPEVIVRTTPKDKTYVGLRTTLRVQGFDNVSTTPIGPVNQTVMLTAEPKSVKWNLGETTDFPCKDAGSEDVTTCDYTFKKSSASEAGGLYQISATITWEVAWSCKGDDCDSPGAQLPDHSITSGNTPLTVGEIQTNTGQ